ncbi:hypothetical protein RG47T_4703 [Mucilaginibacter polytrichastri]|uniref:Uncharacterized protein n=2 Tax=Mucilaginibacter polytrichastri TaxID=1302689 RepID=A0A1Q6A5D4_9SPHI|nr:hypothetical protein RG47T_4703 [Mucilaginibacter polytrichastri]
MSGTIQGIKIKYLGYYYSDQKGTVQLLAYTSAMLYKEARAEMETFLNGLVLIN